MARSPQVGVEKRRFKNVTPEIHGATILDADNRAKGVAVDPGEEIWLSVVEEQLTAEAPVRDEDNPFIKAWECPVAWDDHGNPTSFEPRTGCLLVVDAEPRIIGSQRYTPTAGDPNTAVAAETPPEPAAPPVEGERSPDEQVATPEAEAARDEHEKAKAAEAATAIELTPEEIEVRDKEREAAAEERAKAIADGEPGRDRGGVEWAEGQPKGAPAKDRGAESRKPVATQG